MITWIKRRFVAWRAARIIRHLTDARFDKVWKGDDRVAFHDFLRLRGISAGRFLITVQLAEGGLAWFCYTIRKADENSIAFEPVEVAVPHEHESHNRECPPEWKGYPVWRVSNV